MAYNKLSKYKTTWTENGNNGFVVYTSTPIVVWNEDTIELNSDGWESVTTKRKMNQASHQFDLGFSVYQKDFKWYVVTPQGETVEFSDGMQMGRNK